jgi:gamma-butyrobetaine dioxygenase
MLQAAALAERSGAPPARVAAALPHDVGHLTGGGSGRDLKEGTDNRHGDQGGRDRQRPRSPHESFPDRRY